MIRVLACSVVLTAALGFAGVGLAQDEPNVLTENGLGRFKIGSDVEHVELALHDKLGYNQYADHGCSMLTTKALEPTGISFMIEKKILTRINIDYVGTSTEPETIKTDTGVGLGSSEDDVKKAYGSRARIKPNPQDPSWHTIFVEEPDLSRGIVFETDGKTVKSMRAGLNPGISYANGCS